MLVPIGSWCRTAFQVRTFLEMQGGKSVSYPFDWTITSFSALQNTLQKDFDPAKVLLPKDLQLSKVGSIIDTKTGIIHHHDFLPKVIADFRNSEGGLSAQFFASGLIEEARGRFIHTYENLMKLRKYKGKIGFVRWQRFGDPDRQFPSVFEGENLGTLKSTLSKFLESENFSILLVKTNIVPNEIYSDDIYLSYQSNEYGVEALIKERMGFNGDGTKNFKGDSTSWHSLLKRFVDEQNISVVNATS